MSMQFISYAQNFEDVILWRSLKHIHNGFYIDVGAAWPDTHSVTKAFYNANWRGINIEPNLELSQRLQDHRERDINLQIALSDQPGRMDFYVIKDTGLSTLDESIAKQHEEANWKTDVQEINISTLAAVWTEFVPEGQQVHFLKVDVEGLEEEVLRGNNWKKYRPWVVIIEATLPLSKEESYSSSEQLLLEADYVFAYSDGLNRFYVAREHGDLLPDFKYPPNVFDDFVLIDKVEADRRAEEASRQVEEADRRAEVASRQVEEADRQVEVASRQVEEADRRAEVASRQVEEADRRAEQANRQVEEASRQIEEAERRAEEVGRLKKTISWRLTYPLRALNPRTFRGYIMHILGKVAMDNPRLALMVKPFLKKNSASWMKLKQEALYRNSSTVNDNDYHCLSFDRFDVLFSKGPLADLRGIGRVSNQLLSEFRTFTTSIKDLDDSGSTQSRTKIYFYSSCHWCPDQLPNRSVVMIHDVIPMLFPEKFPAESNEWLIRYKPIAQQAEAVVTISHSSARDISELLEIPLERIHVVYNGVSALPVGEACSINLPTNPYIVFLGSHDKHKNADIILKAMKDPALDSISLVFIGDNKSLISRVKNLNLIDRVHFLGIVEDSEIGFIISQAKALVFPSYYEGFGLPPLEAALLGTPSICSNRPAMNEIMDGVALFADPDSPEDWVNAIGRMLVPELRNELILSARSRAEEFTWEKAALEYMKILKEAAASMADKPS